MHSFREIFPEKEFLFIAEIGLNHNGNIDIARRMIKDAYNAGANAVKFQTFVPDNMNSVYTSSLISTGIEKEPSSSERDFFKQFVLSKKEYFELFSFASGLKIEFFSSPFDPESVDLLEQTGVRLYKIASSEVTNHILLKKIAATKKPVIMSTGVSNESEISSAIDILKKNGTPDIILMHCVSLYPLPLESANLTRITALKNRYNLEVGFSDHSTDSRTCEVAAALGAKVFEKHFIPERNFECPDKDVSVTPDEFNKIVKSVRLINIMLGSGEINYSESEKKVARLARKSLFAKRNIPVGKSLTYDDVIAKRPGIGIPVYNLDSLIGKVANTEIKEDHLIKSEYFD